MTKTTEGLQKVKLGQASVVLVIWSFTPSSFFLPKKFRYRGIIVALVLLPNLVSSSFNTQLPFITFLRLTIAQLIVSEAANSTIFWRNKAGKRNSIDTFLEHPKSKIKEISSNSGDFKLFERKQHTGTQS